jgi:hypothetical protein
MKVVVELEDTLQETVDSTIDEVKDKIIDWLKDNPDASDIDIYNDIDIYEVVDSNTPIYFKEINDLYYLYSDELDEAYTNQGIGDRSEENYKQVAIYCYIQEQVNEWWYNNGKDEVDEIFEKRDELQNQVDEDKITEDEFNKEFVVLVEEFWK